MNTSSRGIRGIILTQLIGKIGFNIAQHVKSIAEDKIEVEKLNLYFKIDPKGIINFLFCSDIQYSNPEQAVSDQQLKKIIFDRAHSEPQVVSASHRFDEEMLVVNRPRQLQKTHFCVSCGQNTNKTKIYEIKLENIAAHHNNNRLLNENRTSQAFGRQKPSAAEQTQHDGGHFPNFSESHNGQTASQDEANEEETDRDGLRRRKLQVGNNIPPEIQTLFPNIDKDMYAKLSQNQTFLERIVTVCEDCYLFLISLRQTSGSESYKKFQLLRDDIKLKGTGRLRPDTLGIRYRDTRERIEEDVVGKFFRDQILGEVAKGDARARRIFEAKEMLRLKSNSITQRPGTINMRADAQLQNKITSPLFTQTFSSLDPLGLKLPQTKANPSSSPSKFPSASHLASQNRFHVHDSSLKLEEKTTALGSKRSESGAFNVSSPKQPTKKRLDRLFHKSFHSRFVSDELSTEKTLLGMPFYQAAKQKPANFEKSQGPGYLPQAVSAVKLVGFGAGHSVAELSALEPHEKESSVETKVVDYAQSMSAGAQSQEDPARQWAIRPKPKKSKQRNFSITSLSSRFDMYTGGG